MTRVFCLLACALLAAATVRANPPATTADIQPADIAQFVEQLQSPAFSERQEATRQLSEAGQVAFPELERLTQSGSREVSGRALDVLKGHFQRGDNATKTAAGAILERLAKSSNAAIAERAKNVLNPPAQPTAASIAAGFAAAPIRVVNLPLQIVPNAMPAGMGRSTSVRRSANGDIKIEIRDNGKVTTIQSAAGGKIAVEITDAKNAQANKKFEAKDLAELKQKDAEVARLYEQYNQPARVQIGAIRPAAAPLTPAESLKQRLKSLDSQIERYQAQLKDNPGIQRSIDTLKSMRSRYEQQLKDLPAEAARPAEAAKPTEAEKAVGGQ